MEAYFVEEVIAVRVDLQALLVLQEKDSAIAAVERQLRALEPEIENLDADLADVEGNEVTQYGQAQQQGHPNKCGQPLADSPTIHHQPGKNGHSY